MAESDPVLVKIGVTGGIATGKTTVSTILNEFGCPLIDFDYLARVVVAPNKPAWQAIVNHFGQSVLLPNGELNRKKISEIVFNDLSQKEILEQITHPYILAEFYSSLKHIIDNGSPTFVQAGVPLLFEAKLEALFDVIIVVYVTPDEQIKRLVHRDKIDRQHALQIINSQMPLEYKKKHADFIVDNSGSLEQTRSQIVNIIAALTHKSEKKSK